MLCESATILALVVNEKPTDRSLRSTRSTNDKTETVNLSGPGESAREHAVT